MCVAASNPPRVNEVGQLVWKSSPSSAACESKARGCRGDLTASDSTWKASSATPHGTNVARMEPFEVTEHGRLLIHRPGYSAAFVQETLAREQLNGLSVLALLPDEAPASLEFLREFSFLTHLELTAMPIEDYDYGALAYLSNLQHFMLNVTIVPPHKPRPLDLSQWPRLKSLTLTWRDGISGIEALTELEDLRLMEFRGEDLRGFAGARALKKLVIKDANIRSVAGIEAHPHLQSVLLAACRRLQHIDDLAAVAGLRELTLDGCPRLTELGPLAALHDLSQLTLADCRRLESIQPLAGLKLERLDISGSTDIRDGDITPARAARDLFYRHREHYNAKLPTPLQDAIVAQNIRNIRGLEP